MAYATLSTWDEVLKTFYLPAIQEQLNEDTILSDIIDTNEEDVSGKKATIECHYGRTTGTGARADGADLPTANYQKFKTCTVPMRYNYGRVAFTGPTIAATRDEKGAYARVVDTEIRGVVNDLQKEVNRQLFGCGWGVLARWRTGADASWTVNKLYTGNSVGGDGFGSAFGGKYFEERSDGVWVVLIGTSSITATTVDTTDMSVDAVDTSETDYDTLASGSSPGVIEAGGTFAVRPASLVSYGSGSSAGAARLEMMGLRGIVTDTDLDVIALYNASDTGIATPADPLQTLDVSTYPWWKSKVDSHANGRYAAQRALTLKNMQKMFDNVEKTAGKGYGPDMIMTTRAIRREYLDLLQDRRREANTMSLDGGWTALDYNGIPLMVDSDAIDGEMYFLTTKDLQIYRMSDYDWMTKDGAILSRISNKDAYEAVFFRYAELGTKRRNSHGVMTDISYEAD